MKIPNKIKIGWRKYKVINIKNLKDDEENKVWGQIDYSNNIIKLEKNLNEDFRKTVFIHETLHGIFHSIGREDLDDDEVLIDALSERLYEIIKENNFLRSE